MKATVRSAVAVVSAVVSWQAHAQSSPNITALRGLAAVATLPNFQEGRAALAANLAVTGDIQTGKQRQPILLPFSEQQHLALRDSFITDGNATGLADGLGTRLAEAYQAKARYENAAAFTSVSQSVADLIGYTNNVAKSDSNAGKYFFANTTKNGKMRVSEAALAILADNGGTTDVFGKAYQRPAGSQGAGLYGNARPFQSEPTLLAFRGADYFARASHSLDWLRGPNQDLTESPSYPSGHTTYGYTESVLLAVLVPQRYQQMITRAAEYGNDRIIMGAHYAMDVLGGRATALHAVAHLLANDSAYVGQFRRNPAVVDATTSRPADEVVAVADYQAALKGARDDLDAFFTRACNGAISACAAGDTGRFKNPAANEALYDATQTYGLPVVHRNTAGKVEDIGKIAPEAGYLLTAAFPSIALDEANAILTATEGPGGGFLDDGSAFGVYSRINLYAAAGEAAALAARKQTKTQVSR